MCSLFLQDTLSTFHCFHASDLIEFLQRRPDIHFARMDLIFHEVFETCFSVSQYGELLVNTLIFSS